MQRRFRTISAAWVATLAVLAVAIPLSATGTNAETDGAQIKLPAPLAAWRSPLPHKRTKAVATKVAETYGPGKKLPPRFKADATPEQRLAAIKGIDEVAKLAKADPAASIHTRDSVKMWQSMTVTQKQALLGESESVMAAWPAAVGLAAGVAAVVVTAAFVGAVVEEVKELAKDGGDDAESGDETDTPDTEAIRTALGY